MSMIVTSCVVACRTVPATVLRKNDLDRDGARIVRLG